MLILMLVYLPLLATKLHLTLTGKSVTLVHECGTALYLKVKQLHISILCHIKIHICCYCLFYICMPSLQAAEGSWDMWS